VLRRNTGKLPAESAPVSLPPNHRLNTSPVMSSPTLKYRYITSRLLSLPFRLELQRSHKTSTRKKIAFQCANYECNTFRAGNTQQSATGTSSSKTKQNKKTKKLAAHKQFPATQCAIFTVVTERVWVQRMAAMKYSSRLLAARRQKSH